MKFCFIAPYYSEQSNGIRVFYKAALLFAQAKADCIIKICDTETNQVLVKPNLRKIPKKFHFLISNDKNLPSNYIYVLPETPSNLPKNLNRNFKIVRYLLANPFFLNRGAIDFKNNFLLSYSNLISDRLPQLFINAMPDLPKKKIRSNQNKKILIYFGKFRLEKKIIKNSDFINNILDKYDDIEIIHRNYPNKHEDYLQKLKTTDLLISYDFMSSVSQEASLMGIPVIIIDSLNINVSFNCEQQNIYFLEELYSDINLINEINAIPYKNTIENKISKKKHIELIKSYFSKPNIKFKLDNIFYDEMTRMKKIYLMNFKEGIINFNSCGKIFLLVLFYLYPNSYKVIEKHLVKNKKNIISFSFFGFGSLIFYLRFRSIFFIYFALKLFFLYKISNRKFIKEFNNLLT
jgi:hypothetical protein